MLICLIQAKQKLKTRIVKINNNESKSYTLLKKHSRGHKVMYKKKE